MRDNRGVIKMGGQGDEGAVVDIRATYGDMPVLIAGMAGSNRSWREAP